MGISKTQAFSKQQNQIAEYAKAFSHPARVAIIEHLLKKQTCICGDLVDVLPLSQSTVSQHLKELKRIGLIKGEVAGPRMCYCIDEKAWKAAREMLNDIFTLFKGCC